MNIPSIKEQTSELILNALKLKYNSVSCKDNIVAGNHYQSVMLGTTETKGFRTSRAEFLDQIRFKGTKVLDLGSNLGEISRSARERGAYLVDGFEYDPFFIEVACLVNAYNNTTRTSFYQRDITDPSIYTEHYDIVLALSVFTFIRSVVGEIAAITNKLFVVETHKLENNLESSYLRPVLPYFPYYKILGESEWSRQSNTSETRAVIAFAKNESTLGSLLAASVPSESARAGSALDDQPNPLSSSIFEVDTSRTCLQENFFSRYAGTSTNDMITAIEAMEFDLDALAESEDLKRSVYSGWAYWALFIKGYLEYCSKGTVEVANIYYDYMMNYYAPRQHDPGLANVLANPQRAHARVTHRFQDFDLCRHSAGCDENVKEKLEPVKVFSGDASRRHGLLVYQIGSDQPVAGYAVDGWHRLFSARLWKIEKLRGEIVRAGT